IEPGEGFAVPDARTSLDQIRLNLEQIARHENRGDLYRALATRAGLSIPPKSCWLLYRLADQPECSVEDVAGRLKVDTTLIEPGLRGLIEAGLLAGHDGQGDSRTSSLHLTPSGLDALDRVRAARRAGLTELLEGWDMEAHPEIAVMVGQLAEALLADDEKLLADARPVRVG
ncbi:MAG: MarR family winged helix-turn-helix transcriptional regulator, partial [Acidimicrobiales bacterium]